LKSGDFDLRENNNISRRVRMKSKERKKMRQNRLSIVVLLGLILISRADRVRAQTGIQPGSDLAMLTFPQSVTFQAEFQAGVNITSVVLEYGVDQMTCGTVVAKAMPALTPAKDVHVEWTWDMRQLLPNSFPPGASIWWRWQVQDANGAQYTSTRKAVTWLDSVHDWSLISGGNINLHYYEGGQDFGRALHEAAAQALVRLSQEVGLQLETPVDIYIYANTTDLKDAILYKPTWIGGKAFPEYNIVIIGVSSDQLEWGKSTEAHELTHVLVNRLAFSCLGFIPNWLSEGLAMYGEGGPQSELVAQFDQAKVSNQLPSLRSLTGGFPEDATRANLAYSESYSVVEYLIITYGRDKMTALLMALRDGATADEALQNVYGLNTEGLEDAWRASIGAVPRVGSVNSTPIPTATQVPTFVPIGAAPVAPAVATPRPTQVQDTPSPSATSQGLVPTVTNMPLNKRLGISRQILTVVEFGLVGCVLALVVIAVVVFFTTRRHTRRRK
jgi:hypothetical protein